VSRVSAKPFRRPYCISSEATNAKQHQPSRSRAVQVALLAAFAMMSRLDFRTCGYLKIQ